MPLALILALALQDAPAADPEIAELHHAYEQSCLQRDYGSFDDVCNQIADQIARYERSHRPVQARAPARPRTLASAPAAPSAAPPPLPGTPADPAR